MAYLKDVSRREEEGEGVLEERAGSLVSESPRTFFVIRGGSSVLCLQLSSPKTTLRDGYMQ